MADYSFSDHGEVARTGRAHSALQVIVTADPDTRLLAAWGALVAAAQHEPQPDGSPVDISAARRARPGYEPLYVFIREGCELLGGVRLLRRRVPGVGWVAYLPDIPIVVDELGPRRVLVLQRLAQSLMTLERQHAGLFLEPPDDPIER